MKKILSLLLIFTMVIGFAACSRGEKPGEATKSPSKSSPTKTTSSPSPSTTSPSPSTSTSTSTSTATATETKQATSKTEYKDGTYTAKGDPWEYGMEDATIIIKDKKIMDVQLRRLDKEGKAEIDYTLFDGKEHNGKLYPNLIEFKEKMEKEMIKKQKAGVETISGATKSTTNWIVAAQRALDKAK